MKKISEDLIEEIKAIFTEREFNSRWELINCYHQVGEIIQEVEREELQELASRIGRSERTLYYAKQFYQVYPNLDELPEGKNVSMNKIITKYLPTTKQAECQHVNKETISFQKCTDCRKHLGKLEEGR